MKPSPSSSWSRSVAERFTFGPHPGELFFIDALSAGETKLKAETFLEIYKIDGTLLMEIEFHTSCSHPLSIGDQFGAAELVDFIPEGGGGVEGFILSKNSDFSTDDRDFTTSDTIYIKLWSDVVDHSDINHRKWELKDSAQVKVDGELINHMDDTYKIAFDLSDLPSSDRDWEFKSHVDDHQGHRFEVTADITVLP